jgi:hypothetical protein
MHTEIWTESLEERDGLEDLCADERMLLRKVLKKQFGRVCTGCVSLRIHSRDGHV